MAIKKAPKEIEAFVNAAPDGLAKAVATDATSEQIQITLKMPVTLLASIDAAAKAVNLSRAGFIKMSLSNALKG
jgi:putative heme iron utilization protein